MEPVRWAQPWYVGQGDSCERVSRRIGREAEPEEGQTTATERGIAGLTIMAYDISGTSTGRQTSWRRFSARSTIATGRRLASPERQAIFVGDFIDRGPAQVRSVQIVRRMVDAGAALAVMGNHELNAIAWHTPDPRRPGQYSTVTRHAKWGEKNRKQHAAFLAEVEDNPTLHRELIDWFLGLPLWLELPELRVVHACWHPAFIPWLGGAAGEAISHEGFDGRGDRRAGK